MIVLGGRQKDPRSRLIAGELEASVKQRAEPEAEAIATIADLNPKQKKKRTLETKSEEEQEPLDTSGVIRHERMIIKKKKEKKKTNYLQR